MSAIELAAQIRLRRDQLQADIRAVQKDMDSALAAGAKMGGRPKMEVEVKLSPDTQQKLNAAIQNIKVQPVNVPVNFIPGGMPGGGGMPFGASSPNWSMMLAQQSQQIIAGLAPTSSPNWSYLLRNRGGLGPGGGGGQGNLYNPFSPRGLARLMGSGLAVYGAIEAMNLVSGGIDAARTYGSGGEILRGMDHMGSPTYAGGDQFMRRQADAMAGVRGGQQVVGAFESIPVVGTLVRFVDALTGASHGLEELTKVNERITQARQYFVEKENSGAIRDAALTHDPVKELSERHFQEHKTALADVARARDEAEHALSDPLGLMESKASRRTRIQNTSDLWTQATKNLKDTEARQKKEMAQAQAAEASRNATSAANVTASGYRAAASGDEASGRPLDAILHANAAEMRQLEAGFDARMVNVSGPEADRIRAEKKAAVTALEAKQGLTYSRAAASQGISVAGMIGEAGVIGTRMSGQTDKAERDALAVKQNQRYEQLKLTNATEAETYKNTLAPKEAAQLEDEQKRRREKEAGDSAAKIADLEKMAGEKMLHARGEVYTAMIEASKRQTDARAAQLEREAAAEKDTVRKGELTREAAATREAGKAEQAAIRTAAEREAATGARTSGASLGAARLAAGGQNRAARDSQIEAEYQEEVRQINESGATGKAKQDQLQAAANRRDTKKAAAAHDDAAQRRSMGIATADAQGRAQGQAGVGDALDMLAEFHDMEANAQTLQDAQAVRRYEQARVAAYKREHKPQGGRSYDLLGYHDAIQESITSGSRYDESLKLLNNAMGRKGMPQPGAGDPMKQSDRDLRDAAKDLNDATNKIKNAKGIAVIG